MPKKLEEENPELQKALSESPGYLLSATSRCIRAVTGEALQPFALSLNDYVVMRLVGMKARLSQGAVGDTYGIDPATMVGVIDKLEERHLIVRERDSEDRRRYILRLTPTGTKLLTRVRATVTKAQRRFLEPLSEPEWETVRFALMKLLVNAMENRSL